MTQGMEQDSLYKESDSKEDNPYQFMITNDYEKINININTSQMEQISIFSEDIKLCSVGTKNLIID